MGEGPPVPETRVLAVASHVRLTPIPEEDEQSLCFFPHHVADVLVLTKYPRWCPGESYTPSLAASDSSPSRKSKRDATPPHTRYQSMVC